ncbi:NAD/NADP octopine/nopaline dehydrogenase family protein [Sinorhizobium sp. Sb3]|uniref:NAD/NADP octopine/nopaline dehydrogenase family protein n=1 Tax=Sinorhizobium sp. Sb3 TaxID=1358417 RepID=UPI001FD92CDF|nr:NAD/NADP octopine/nopaline dehydrogenase family protein [Sinorhizobium sp. Sb3]
MATTSARASNAPAIIANGNVIDVEGPKLGGSYFVRIGSIAEVVRSTRVIFNTVPTSGHGPVLEELAEHDLSQHLLVSLPGNGFTMSARKHFKPERFPRNIIESSTAPAASRLNGAKAMVGDFKTRMELAALHPLTDAEKAEFAAYFPQVEHLDWLGNLASIFCANTNPFVHIPILHKYMNCPGKQSLGFYTDCAPNVVAEIEKFDAWRLSVVDAVSAATGIKIDVKGYFETAKDWYGSDAQTYGAFAKGLKAYQNILFPADVKSSRMVQEDIKRNLVFWCEIARKAGHSVDLPAKYITEVGAELDVNLLEDGWTLTSIGFENASLGEIVSYLNGSPRA